VERPLLAPDVPLLVPELPELVDVRPLPVVLVPLPPVVPVPALLEALALEVLAVWLEPLLATSPVVPPPQAVTTTTPIHVADHHPVADLSRRISSSSSGLVVPRTSCNARALSMLSNFEWLRSAYRLTGVKITAHAVVQETAPALSLPADCCPGRLTSRKRPA
jgi:hypothetical protein